MKINLPKLKIQILGSAHSNLKIIIKGLIKNTPYDFTLLDTFLQRRKPQASYETKRRDLDLFTITKGVKNNKLSPKVCATFKTNNTSLAKYEVFNHHPRPGHADFARIKKYGTITNQTSDIYSGRISIGYVVAGALIKMHLPNIQINSEIVQIGNETNNALFDELLTKTKTNFDSISGIIKLTINGVPAGIGGQEEMPLDSLLAMLLYKVPGVKAISFGLPFTDLAYLGSQYNDIIINEKGTTNTNHCGGITGGLSNGNEIVIYLFMRPASSIYRPQKTFHLKEKKLALLTISGAHDSFYLKRAQVILEAMAYLALYNYF